MKQRTTKFLILDHEEQEAIMMALKLYESDLRIQQSFGVEGADQIDRTVKRLIERIRP